MKRSVLFLTVIALVACKKEYTCTCHNPGGKQEVFTVKDSKKNADSKCRKYYDDHFGGIPMSETECAID